VQAIFTLDTETQPEFFRKRSTIYTFFFELVMKDSPFGCIEQSDQRGTSLISTSAPQAGYPST
jgi:hypothetical protein